MFFYVLIIVAILVVILLFSSLKIKVNNIHLSTENIEEGMLNDDYKICIILYILKIIPILKVCITKEKLDKLQIQEKLKKVDIKKIKLRKINKEQIRIINKYKPCIKKIKLFMDIGVEDAVLTSYLVAFISSLLGVTLRKALQQTQENIFLINPIYNRMLLKVNLNCVIEVKIINMVYVLNKLYK